MSGISEWGDLSFAKRQLHGQTCENNGKGSLDALNGRFPITTTDLSNEQIKKAWTYRSLNASLTASAAKTTANDRWMRLTAVSE